MRTIRSNMPSAGRTLALRIADSGSAKSVRAGVISAIHSCVITAYLIGLAGCGSFFSHEPTELQNREIFRSLREVQVVPDVDRPLPDIYTAEPAIVAFEDNVKLFYFTRQQSPSLLASLVKEQLGHQVSQNPATNQLVVQCATETDARHLLDFLKRVDVPPIQVKVDCLISELFADVTMDYETRLDVQHLFGESIALGSHLPGASLRSVARSDMGLKASITRNNLDTLIDLLESRGYAKVLMRPSVEVVNGKTARIQMKERIPTPEKILSGSMVIDTVKYQDIIDYLEVTPQVYADGTIGLRTSAGIASKSPDGVEQVPVLTERQIDNEENRLRKGQSLVIGGIVKTEQMSVIRGIPVLKDIPGVGVLFSGKDFEDRAKEILFILTPSISSNGNDHTATIDMVREKHAKVVTKREGDSGTEEDSQCLSATGQRPPNGDVP